MPPPPAPPVAPPPVASPPVAPPPVAPPPPIVPPPPPTAAPPAPPVAPPGPGPAGATSEDAAPEGTGPGDSAPDEPSTETETAGDGDLGDGADTEAQPVLGHLQIEGGERIALDRPVLFGRRPPESATIDDTEARVVTLAGSDALSRSHAQFRFDGTDVQVVDLGSANHTYVTAPGKDPVRLRPDEPFTLEPGSVVSLADAVRLTFERPD